MLKALSHENRLLILCLLAEGEKSVSELEDIMDMPQAAVSQQLARLRFDGLVNARRDGRSIHYSIASDEVSSVIETLHQLFCRPQRPPIKRKPAQQLTPVPAGHRSRPGWINPDEVDRGYCSAGRGFPSRAVSPSAPSPGLRRAMPISAR